jgi:membrane protein
VIKKFTRGEDPPTAEQISCTLKIPIRLVRQLLDELVEGGIFSETLAKNDEEIGFQPARDTGIMTIGYVIDALEQRGNNELRIPQTDELKVISTSLQTFRNQIKKSPANRLLEEI